MLHLLQYSMLHMLQSQAAVHVQVQAVAVSSALSRAPQLPAAAAKVLTSILTAWDECLPGQLATQPDVTGLECLVAIVDSALMLLDIVAIPALHSGAAQCSNCVFLGVFVRMDACLMLSPIHQTLITGCLHVYVTGQLTDSVPTASAHAEATPLQQEMHQECLAFISSRASVVFPAAVPVVHPSDAVSRQLAQLNTLLVRFMTAGLLMAGSCDHPTILPIVRKGHAHAKQRTKPTGSRGSASKPSIGDRIGALVHSTAVASNAYACFTHASAQNALGGPAKSSRPEALPDVPSDVAVAETVSAQPNWLPSLLEYCTAAVLDDVAVPALEGMASSEKAIAGSASSFSSALRAMESALPVVCSPWRRRMMQ